MEILVEFRRVTPALSSIIYFVLRNKLLNSYEHTSWSELTLAIFFCMCEVVFFFCNSYKTYFSTGEIAVISKSLKYFLIRPPYPQLL